MKTDIEEKIMLDQIPAVLYGAGCERCFLYLHGKLGCKEEAKAFAGIVVPKGWQVLSMDLPEHGERKREKDCFNPWCVVPELQMVLQYMQQRWKTIALKADSIGAWFAMQSFEGTEFERCLFVSPVLDMEQLIQNMMQWAGVSEERLEAELWIPTDFGETLSWKYYEYAKTHPITKWQCRTYILYGENDNMTARDVAEKFAGQFCASLTVMEDGEHWFHTPKQLEVLHQWIKESICNMKQILVVVGGGRPRGNTMQLVDAFIKGAEEAGNSVEKVSLSKLEVKGCLGCNACRYGKPCIQKDDFNRLVPKIKAADLIVFASPLYFWTISSRLKAFIERFYCIAQEDHNPPFGRYERYPVKECALLMTSADELFWTFHQAVSYYQFAIVNYIGFRDKGMLLAGGCGDTNGKPQIDKTQYLKQAYEFGRDIYSTSSQKVGEMNQ